jgi:xanthine dehydrogenase accessory factor
VETAVVEQALEVLAGGQPRLLKFGVSDDDAWEVGLTCGGKISIFVERLDSVWWQQAAEAARHNRAAITVTALDGELAGRKLLVDGSGAALYGALDAIPGSAITGYVTPQEADINGLHVMVDVHRPRPHLILIGGVHIAQPLQSFARQLGFRVSLIDPRGVFASRERFPEVETILHSYPDKALPQLGLDADTYLAVLTHDPKIDDKALLTALPSPAAYIGVLSSRKTHDARVARLGKAGLAPDLIARIRTPIGVDIDARTPEEIALSIMAEIIAVRNRAGSAQPAAQAVP